MEDSIYAYVKKFPYYKTFISAKTADSSSQHKTDCDDFKTNNLCSKESNDGSFDKSCSKISKYATELKTSEKTPKPAFCNYINYWFYGAIKETEITSYSTLLGQFYNKFKNLEACVKYKGDISTKEYEELKFLFELYEDFKTFKEVSSKESQDDCESVTQCIEKYKQKLKDCQENYNNGLCMNLINFKYEYDDHKLKAKSCVHKMEDLEPIRSDIVAKVLMPFVVMTLISFILIFLYKFTSFGPWIRPKLGWKNRTNKLDKRIQELQNTSELDGRRYKLPYHS